MKARLDELLASKRVLLDYAEGIIEDRERREEHLEWYSHAGAFFFSWEKAFDEYEKKHLKLIDAAVKDGVIDDPTLWMVIKP